MDETSLNAKYGTEGISYFQSVLAHHLAYCDPFSLQVALIKHISFNWDSLYSRLSSHCKAWSYKKKKQKKIKSYQKSLYREPAVNRCLLILKPYPKTRTTEPSGNFLHLRETSLDTSEVEHFRLFFVFLVVGLVNLGWEYLNFSNAPNTEKEV